MSIGDKQRRCLKFRWSVGKVACVSRERLGPVLSLSGGALGPDTGGCPLSGFREGGMHDWHCLSVSSRPLPHHGPRKHFGMHQSENQFPTEFFRISNIGGFQSPTFHGGEGYTNNFGIQWSLTHHSRNLPIRMIADVLPLWMFGPYG